MCSFSVTGEKTRQASAYSSGAETWVAWHRATESSRLGRPPCNSAELGCPHPHSTILVCVPLRPRQRQHFSHCRGGQGDIEVPCRPRIYQAGKSLGPGSAAGRVLIGHGAPRRAIVFPGLIIKSHDQQGERKGCWEPSGPGSGRQQVLRGVPTASRACGENDNRSDSPTKCPVCPSSVGASPAPLFSPWGLFWSR